MYVCMYIFYSTTNDKVKYLILYSCNIYMKIDKKFILFFVYQKVFFVVTNNGNGSFWISTKSDNWQTT